MKRKKRTAWRITWCLLCGIFPVLHSQAQDTILVAGVTPQLYIYHAVQPKENFYSIGRRFQVSPKAIADINHVQMQDGLKKYQIIKIPLTADNFTQAGKPAGTQSKPLLHKVQHGETLYRISNDLNKVSLKKLQDWNHLRGNSVSTGQYLVVGWLKTGEEDIASTIASPAANTQPLAESTPPQAAEPAKEEVAAVTAATPAPASEPAPKANDDASHDFLNEVIASEQARRSGATSASAPAAPAKTNDAIVPPPASAAPAQVAAAAEPAPAPTPAARKEQPAPDNDFSRMLSKVSQQNNHQPANQPAANTGTSTPVPSVPQPAANPVVPQQQDNTAPATNDNEAADPADTGVAVNDNAAGPASASPFEASYKEQTDNGTKVTVQKGAGTWFKSNVAAGSGRFYALHATAGRGTIIKVINPVNGKFVYVKVLDTIPKLGNNYNIVIKVSDAAMQALGTQQARFWCELQYQKK